MRKILALLLSVLLLAAGLPIAASAVDVVAGAATELDGKYYSLGEVLYENDFENETDRVLPAGWEAGKPSYVWVGGGAVEAFAFKTWDNKKVFYFGATNTDGLVSLPTINTRNYMFEADIIVNTGYIGIANNIVGGVNGSTGAVINRFSPSGNTNPNITFSKGDAGVAQTTITLPTENPASGETVKVKIISFEGKSYFYYNGTLVSSYANAYPGSTTDCVGFFGCNSYFTADNVKITALKVAEPTYIIGDNYFKMGEVLYENDFETSTHEVLPEGWESGRPSYVWKGGGGDPSVKAWHNGDGKKYLAFGASGSDGMAFSPVINTRNYVFEADIIVNTAYIGVANNKPGGLNGSTGAVINRFSPSGNTNPNITFSKGDAGVAQTTITLPTENPASGETVKVKIISLDGSSYFYYNGTLVSSYTNAYPGSTTDCVGFFGCNSWFNVDNVVITALNIVKPTYVLDGKEFTEGDVLYENDFQNTTSGEIAEGWTAGIPTYGWNHATGSVPSYAVFHETWSPYGRYISIGTGGYDGYVAAPEINTRNYIFEADVTVNTANNATIGIANNMAGGIANSQAAVLSGIRLNGSTAAHYTQSKGTADVTINQTITLDANPVNKEVIKVKLISFEGKSYLYLNGDVVSTYSNLYKDEKSDYVAFYGCNGWLNVDNVVVTAIDIPGEEPEDTVEIVEIAGINAVKVAENVEDNNAYKVSLTMNADVAANVGFFTADADNAASVGYVEGANATIISVEAGATAAEAFVTVDKKGSTADAVGSDLYMYVIDGDVSALNISEASAVLLTDVTGEKPLLTQAGISMLEGVAENNNQALRYYFNYDSINGNDIIIDGEVYTVKSRGFLVTNGTANANAQITRSAANGTTVKDINVTKLANCWNAVANNDALNSSELTYSIYVTGFKPVNGTYNNTSRLYVKGYVVVEVNGVEYTLYSEELNMTVSEVANLV